jgi:hypothetical protein
MVDGRLFYHLFYTIDISILNCERERDFAQIDKILVKMKKKKTKLRRGRQFIFLFIIVSP